jgi:hypothetical protein
MSHRAHLFSSPQIGCALVAVLGLVSQLRAVARLFAHICHGSIVDIHGRHRSLDLSDMFFNEFYAP